MLYVKKDKCNVRRHAYSFPHRRVIVAGYVMRPGWVEFNKSAQTLLFCCLTNSLKCVVLD